MIILTYPVFISFPYEKFIIAKISNKCLDIHDDLSSSKLIQNTGF